MDRWMFGWMIVNGGIMNGCMVNGCMVDGGCKMWVG